MQTRIGNPEEWHAQFEGLDFLRIINKYHPDTLMQHLDHFSTFLRDSIDNLRSGISKDALMFTTEFFNNKELLTNPEYEEYIIRFIDVVMPSIVFKTVYEKSFIAKEA